MYLLILGHIVALLVGPEIPAGHPHRTRDPLDSRPDTCEGGSAAGLLIPSVSKEWMTSSLFSLTFLHYPLITRLAPNAPAKTAAVWPWLRPMPGRVRRERKLRKRMTLSI
jgi:hypothetical protein